MIPYALRKQQAPDCRKLLDENASCAKIILYRFFLTTPSTRATEVCHENKLRSDTERLPDYLLPADIAKFKKNVTSIIKVNVICSQKTFAGPHPEEDIVRYGLAIYRAHLYLGGLWCYVKDNSLRRIFTRPNDGTIPFVTADIGAAEIWAGLAHLEQIIAGKTAGKFFPNIHLHIHQTATAPRCSRCGFLRCGCGAKLTPR